MRPSKKIKILMDLYLLFFDTYLLFVSRFPIKHLTTLLKKYNKMIINKKNFRTVELLTVNCKYHLSKKIVLTKFGYDNIDNEFLSLSFSVQRTRTKKSIRSYYEVLLKSITPSCSNPRYDNDSSIVNYDNYKTFIIPDFRKSMRNFMFLKKNSFDNIEYNSDPTIEAEIIILFICLSKAPNRGLAISYSSILLMSHISRLLRYFLNSERLAALSWSVNADLYTKKNQDFQMLKKVIDFLLKLDDQLSLNVKSLNSLIERLLVFFRAAYKGLFEVNSFVFLPPKKKPSKEGWLFFWRQKHKRNQFLKKPFNVVNALLAWQPSKKYNFIVSSTTVEQAVNLFVQ